MSRFQSIDPSGLSTGGSYTLNARTKEY